MDLAVLTGTDLLVLIAGSATLLLWDASNVGLGPPPMLRVRCDDPRLSFCGPRSGGLATMHTV